MNLVIPIIAVIGALLALAVLAPLSERVRSYLGRSAVVLGWLGVLGGAIGIYTEQLAGAGVLLGVAASAGLAILPLGMQLAPARNLAWTLGAALPLVLATLGLTVQVDMAGGNSGLFLLHAGHWGALSAALVSLLVAAGLSSSEGWAKDASRKTPGMGVGVVLASLTIAAWMIGSLRGGPEGIAWSVPLASEAGGVTWQIPPSAALPQGLWLEAVAELAWMGPLLIAAAVLGVVTGLATRFKAGRRASALGWFVTGAVALSGVAGLLSSRTGASLPDPAPYRETASTVLGGIQGAPMLIQQGSFVSEGGVFVPLGDIAPELGMLVAAALIALLAGVFSLRVHWPGSAGEGAERTAMGLHARDYALRGVVFGWLAWLLVTLIHWNHFGAVGVGSPAEWSAVGFLALATGVLLLSWSRRNGRSDRIIRELAPGVMFGLLLFGIATGVVFDAPFGLSIAF
ncbi:hypothetical protein [Persicimonas caeni]|nr:hypothetical protein [Persicimonas caeni]